MRTDVKVGLVAVLVVVLLVITYFAFSHHSSKNSSEGVLPSQQPGLMPATDNTSGAGGTAASVADTNPASASTAGGTASAVIPPAGTQPAAGTQAAPGLVQVAPATGPALTSAAGDGTGPAGSMAATTNSSSGGTLADNTTADNSSVNGSSNPSDNGATGNAGANSGVAVPDNSSGSVNSGTMPPASAGASTDNDSGNSGTGISLGGTSGRHRHHGHTGHRVTLSSREYRVRKGDTLARISVHMYGSARMVRALERANPGLDPRRMRVGQIIHLPRASHVQSVARSGGRRYRRSASRTAAGYTVHGRTYVVRSGDSLRSLARRFYRTSAYWKLIYRANRRKIGANPNNIRVGEKLVIPAH